MFYNFQENSCDWRTDRQTREWSYSGSILHFMYWNLKVTKMYLMADSCTIPYLNTLNNHDKVSNIACFFHSSIREQVLHPNYFSWAHPFRCKGGLRRECISCQIDLTGKHAQLVMQTATRPKKATVEYFNFYVICISDIRLLISKYKG